MRHSTCRMITPNLSGRAKYARETLSFHGVAPVVFDVSLCISPSLFFLHPGIYSIFASRSLVAPQSRTLVHVASTSDCYRRKLGLTILHVLLSAVDRSDLASLYPVLWRTRRTRGLTSSEKMRTAIPATDKSSTEMITMMKKVSYSYRF